MKFQETAIKYGVRFTESGYISKKSKLSLKQLEVLENYSKISSKFAEKYGSTKKQLGDISIEKDVKLPYIDNLLDRFKKQYEEADNVIRGVNIVAYGVKAGTTYSYENWERTTNF